MVCFSHITKFIEVSKDRIFSDIQRMQCSLAKYSITMRKYPIILLYSFYTILSMPNIWQYVASRACQNMIRNKFYDIAIK